MVELARYDSCMWCNRHDDCVDYLPVIGGRGVPIVRILLLISYAFQGQALVFEEVNRRA